MSVFDGQQCYWRYGYDYFVAPPDCYSHHSHLLEDA